MPSMENAYGDVVSFGDTLMEQLGALSLSPEEMAIEELFFTNNITGSLALIMQSVPQYLRPIGSLPSRRS